MCLTEEKLEIGGIIADETETEATSVTTGSKKSKNFTFLDEADEEHGGIKLTHVFYA